MDNVYRKTAGINSFAEQYDSFWDVLSFMSLKALSVVLLDDASKTNKSLNHFLFDENNFY